MDICQMAHMDFLFLQTNGMTKSAGPRTRQLEAHRTSKHIKPRLDIHTELPSPEQDFRHTRMPMPRTFRISRSKLLLPSKDHTTTLPLSVQQM